MSFDLVEIDVLDLVDFHAFFFVILEEEHVKQRFLAQVFHDFVESQACSSQKHLHMCWLLSYID